MGIFYISRYNEWMDILSHGLYGGVLVGRKSRKSFWLAFIFGLAPDLFSFGIFTASVWLGLTSGPDWKGPPDTSLIPHYVYALYNVTHSLVIFAAAFIIVWLLRKKPLWEMFAWFFHVLLDIFTHSFRFFPTPFLWPVSDYRFDGWSWGTPEIFIPNLLVLFSLYGYWLYKRKNKRAL